MPRRSDCPDLSSVQVIDMYPNDDPGRHFVAQLAMDAAYVREYSIYTAEEMLRYEKRNTPRPA